MISSSYMNSMSGKYIIAWNRIYTKWERQKCPRTPSIGTASQKGFDGADLPLSLPLFCSCICISMGVEGRQSQILFSCYYKDKPGHGTAMEIFICALFVWISQRKSLWEVCSLTEHNLTSSWQTVCSACWSGLKNQEDREKKNFL